MRHKKIYSIRDNEAGGTVLGEYTAAEAAQVIGCNYNSISSYASTGARLYGRYSIDPVAWLNGAMSGCFGNGMRQGLGYWNYTVKECNASGITCHGRQETC